MKKKGVIKHMLLASCCFLLLNVYSQKTYWRDYEKTWEIALGAGGMTNYETKDVHPRSYSSQVFREFELNPTVHASFGVAMKYGFLQYALRFTYDRLKYHYDGRYGYGHPGYSSSVTATGSVLNQRVAIRPEVNFGKNRSWGGIILGFYISVPFVNTTQSSGSAKEETFDYVRQIFETRETSIPIMYQFREGIQVGAQAGVQIRLNEYSFVQLKFLAEYLESYGANNHGLYYSVCMAYSFNRQKARDKKKG